MLSPPYISSNSHNIHIYDPQQQHIFAMPHVWSVVGSNFGLEVAGLRSD